MTVLEIMERAGISQTTLALAWIKDAVHHIKSNTKESLKVNKQNVISSEKDYEFPADMIAIDSVSILDTKDDNKYKRISRLVGDLEVSEDTSP